MGFRDLVKNVLRPNLAAPKISPKISGVTGAKVSAAGPVIAFSSAGQPKWTPRRYEALAEEGFKKNVIVYRCGMQIATACSAVPWLLYDDEGSEIDQHPLLDLLRHPNPLQDGVSFLESVYAYLEIAGNAYIEAVRPSDGGAPVELYVLRPDRMKVVPGTTGLPMGYQYSVNGQTTSWPADPLTGASNILHLRRFHPLDDWYGMSPLEAAALSVDQHNAAAAWNQALLNHGARLSGALVYAPKDGPSTLSDDQLRRLREEMGQLYEGSRNAGRPLILEGGLDWREMSLSPKDMDWMAGRNAAARDIALAFGVPAQLVGVPDSQTYSNMAEARMAFYEETALPLLTRVIAGFDHWLTPMFGEALELDYDPDDISALAVRRDAQWTKLQNAGFLSINEKRQAAGYDCVPGGDVVPGVPSPKPEDEPLFMPPAQVSMRGGKFNSNHDPDNGQFTSGDGGDGDDGEDDGPTGNVSQAWVGQPNQGLRDYIANQEQPGADNLPAYGYENHYGSLDENDVALGRYQFRNQSLEDIGLKNSDGDWKTNTPFYQKYGIDSDQAFLDNPSAQEDAMTAYIARQASLTASLYNEYGGHQYNGIAGPITVTQPGLIAAAHRAGVGNVDNYLSFVGDRGGTQGLSLDQLNKAGNYFAPIETRLRGAQNLPYDEPHFPASIPAP